VYKETQDIVTVTEFNTKRYIRILKGKFNYHIVKAIYIFPFIVKYCTSNT